MNPAARRLAVALAAICLSLGAFAAPAAAADPPAWTTPVDVSASGGNPSVAQVATGPDGTITAVWTRNIGGNTIVQTSSSTDRGSSWSTPLDLSAVGGSASVPWVVVAPGGTITVVWYRYNGTDNIIQASSSTDRGSTWSAPLDLSAAGGSAATPFLSAAPGGGITAVWIRDNGNNDIVQTSHSTDGLSWGPPLNLSANGGNALAPQASTAPDGTITVVWYRLNGSSYVAQASSSTDGGASWSAPVDLSDPGARGPRVTTAPDGTITVVWYWFNGSNNIIQASSSTDGGASWSAPVDLSAPGGSATIPHLTAAADGTVIAVWYRSNGTNSIAQASSSTDRGITWSAPIDLSAPGGSATAPRVTSALGGTITVVWYRNNGTNSVVQASSSTDRGTTWSAPIDLSAAGASASSPRPSTAPDGTIMVVWSQGSGTNATIQATTLASVIVEPLPAAAPAAQPILAATGTDAAPLGLTAVLLLLLGGSLAGHRRRTRAL